MATRGDLSRAKLVLVTSILAHRGEHSRLPENTRAAFLAAQEAGADGVELDVRLTSDGVLVVHHDAHVEGVAIESSPRRALPTSVENFDEVISGLGEMMVNVEVKAPEGVRRSVLSDAALVGAVVEVVSRESSLRVWYSSFDLELCRALRAGAGARASVGYLIYRGDPHRALETCQSEGLTALHPHFSLVDASLVADAHQCGVSLHVWTVNDDDVMTSMFQWDVTSVITDSPVRAREIRDGRDQIRTDE